MGSLILWTFKQIYRDRDPDRGRQIDLGREREREREVGLACLK